jgi:tRNA/tmRNA/rRNA uracil-C5-methylase (TrmA/RlmC/RlmD family)
MHGEVLETTIEKLVTGGAGMGRMDGEVVFVRGALPGERVRVRVVRRAKGFIEAALVEILDASPDREDPPDASPGALAGADLFYMKLSAQRAAKREIVRDCFARIARIDLGERLTGPEPAGPAWGYRNKILLHLGSGGRYGMHRRGTHEVIPLDRSLLMPEVFNREALPFLLDLPRAPQALVRLDGRGGFLADLSGVKEKPASFAERVLARIGGIRVPPSCLGLLVSGRVVWGEENLEIPLAGRMFRAHAHSFFQVNLAETEALVRRLGARMEERGRSADRSGPLLLDLYGGVGLFAAALGDRFERVVTVESDRGAVRDARANLARDPDVAKRGTVVPGLVEKVLSGWAESGLPFGDSEGAEVVADPPRTGLGASVVRDLGRLRPRRIDLVSCDPATLARDARLLEAEGYGIERVLLVDMFPQTPHVETVTFLART